MTTPPRREREAYGGFILIAVVAVLAIVFVVWLLGNGGGEPSDPTTNPIETTLPTVPGG